MYMILIIEGQTLGVYVNNECSDNQADIDQGADHQILITDRDKSIVTTN
jgi:hypothetical protein